VIANGETPDVPPEDVAMIRRSRWLLPLVVEPVVVAIPFAVNDALAPESPSTTAWSLFVVVALLAFLPGVRAQYRVHRDGFNSGKRLRSGNERRGTMPLMVAFGLLFRFASPISKALIGGVTAGFLEGAVVGSEIAYVRLLRFARRAPAS
jgi:hypothetical protein